MPSGRRVPTVAVIDVRLRDGNGIDLTRKLRRFFPETKIILHTGDGDAALLAEAFGAGARGVVLKKASLSDLVRAVETVVRGETYVDPAVERAR
jgi:two-component system, NarL family, response regulator DevR